MLFHLANHLTGLMGPQTHAAVMQAGHAVYRGPVIEPLLVLALAFQAVSGVRLAWYWSGFCTDAYRVFQIGSGAYLAVFLLAHVTSGLRVVLIAHGVPATTANRVWSAGLAAAADCRGDRVRSMRRADPAFLHVRIGGRPPLARSDIMALPARRPSAIRRGAFP